MKSTGNFVLHLILASTCFCPPSWAFAPLAPRNVHLGSKRMTTSVFGTSAESSTSSLGVKEEEQLLNEINGMRVREIKKELDDAKISTSDVFEKSDLVQRLYDYRLSNGNSNSNSNDVKDNGGVNTSTSNKEPSPASSSPPASEGSIRVPMDFHSLSSDAVSSNSNVYLRPSPGKFTSITVTLPTKNNQKLNLLVDTACSGVVIRPSVVSKLQLPMLNAGVTMTAAGGTVSGNGVTRLDCIQLMDRDSTIVRDLTVVAQDIGALPPVLDGIIGLSFLEQYHAVSFDFGSGELVLYDNEKTSSFSNYFNPTAYEVVAEANMSKSRQMIYIASVTLDGRGPVKMLVDTGAASTFLNWNGVNDLNMDKSHPLISYNQEALGVMGADNNALALSHRFVLKRRFNFESAGGNSVVGMFAPGVDIAQTNGGNGVNIDIGDLPVLEAMKSEGVCGILGNDVLMHSDVVHLTNLKTNSPKISLLADIRIAIEDN